MGMMEQLWYQQQLNDMEAQDIFEYTFQMGHEIGNIVGRCIDYWLIIHEYSSEL